MNTNNNCGKILDGSENKTNWEEKFDEKFLTEAMNDEKLFKYEANKALIWELKDFISKTLQDAITEERERLRKKVEDMFGEKMGPELKLEIWLRKKEVLSLIPKTE